MRKPPFPAQSGLWGKPTIINNVETLAHAVRIINEGAEQFRKLGTAASPGTKTFALTGHVANTGLVEVPFGTTLRDVVFAIGGGITDRRGKITRDGFKAVQIGGPSGGWRKGPVAGSGARCKRRSYARSNAVWESEGPIA